MSSLDAIGQDLRCTLTCAALYLPSPQLCADPCCQIHLYPTGTCTRLPVGRRCSFPSLLCINFSISLFSYLHGIAAKGTGLEIGRSGSVTCCIYASRQVETCSSPIPPPACAHTRCLFFSFTVFYSSLTCYILTEISRPTFLTLPPLFPRSLSTPSPPLRKEQTSQGQSTKHSLTSYNKTRYMPSHQGWMRQPSRMNRVPPAGRRARDSPHFHC